MKNRRSLLILRLSIFVFVAFATLKAMTESVAEKPDYYKDEGDYGDHVFFEGELQ
jgi:hypothetical protein